MKNMIVRNILIYNLHILNQHTLPTFRNERYESNKIFFSSFTATNQISGLKQFYGNTMKIMMNVVLEDYY